MATNRTLISAIFVRKLCQFVLLLLLVSACGMSTQPATQPAQPPANTASPVADPAPSATTLAQSATQSAPTLPPATLPPPKASGSPSTPISVELEMSRWPALGDEVEVRLTVQSIEPATNIDATIIAPEGVEVTAGALAMKGDVGPNQPLVLTATLRFTTAADITIIGRALHTLANGDIWGDQAVLYLTIAAPGAPPNLTVTPPLAVPSP